ncbi:MAG: uroporphyrinogen-III synthase [Chloroflexota bacterium]
MKVLITRPRAQVEDFAEKLRSVGFEPIFFPVIEIHPVEGNAQLENAIKNIEKYAWVVFTSVNAVDVVFDKTPFTTERAENAEKKEKVSVNSVFSVVKIAAIGPKTADALRKNGIEPDFIPDEYIAEAILPGLGNVQGKWILLPRAEIARKSLPEAITAAGGIPHEIVVYRTLPAQPDPEGLAAVKSGVDVVTFTSASTVENFVAIIQQNGLDPLELPNDPLIACIGPITEQAAREAGFENILVAKKYTTDGLVEAISTQVHT